MSAGMPEMIPPYSKTNGMKWLLHEVFDHLWPWTRQGWLDHKASGSAGLALAVATTVAWGLAASGGLEAGAIIGWWLGWSVYEIIIRMQCKPYVKDGPWWGKSYRKAGRMDMICYVLFKNLLIGAVFFIVLRRLGLLHMVG
jgi:hypothetical protein